MIYDYSDLHYFTYTTVDNPEVVGHTCGHTITVGSLLYTVKTTWIQLYDMYDYH